MTTIGTTAALFAIETHYGLEGDRYKDTLRLISITENEVSKVYQRRWSYSFINSTAHRFLLYTDKEPKGNKSEALTCNTEYIAVFTVKSHLKNAVTRIERCTFRKA